MTWAGSRAASSGYFLTPNWDATTGRIDWEMPGGDVSGVIDALIVIGIQGSPVSSFAPVSGNVLRFDGTQWEPGEPVVVSGSAVPHTLLSATHTDTVPASPVEGDLVAGSGAPASWVRLPAGGCGQFLGVGDSGNLEWQIPTRKTEIYTSGTEINLDECSHKVILNGTSGNPTIVNLPTSPRLGQEVLVKDGAGNAEANNIEILPPSGTTIDGLDTLVLSNDYQAWCLTWIGTEWSII
jgi:hypothetical protein